MVHAIVHWSIQCLIATCHTIIESCKGEKFSWKEIDTVEDYRKALSGFNKKLTKY